VLVQIARDGDGHAALLRGQAAGEGERLAKALPAAAGEIPLAAHGREGTVEVQIGEMEETNAHTCTGTRGERRFVQCSTR
jgi:hypothetical protein